MLTTVSHPESRIRPSILYSKDQLESLAEAAGFWWHSIDLGQGVITKGYKTPAVLERELKTLRLPDLCGKSVLDIGAYSGFYSFEAESRGASRVVALDHFVWALDLPRIMEYWQSCRDRGIVPRAYQDTPYWHPDTLPGKVPYDLAHHVRGSQVETVVDDFMEMDLCSLGKFDVVLYLGVLYHMEDPLRALKRVASVTKELAIIETHAVAVPGYEHLELCEFYSSNQLNGDVSNWWGLNLKALEGACRAAGFRRVEVVSRGNANTLRTSILRLLFGLRRPPHLRVVVHAWK